MIPTFKKESGEKYKGGFVKEIEPGLREHVITLDANSLYPNALISLNISLETKIGKVTYLEDDKVRIHSYLSGEDKDSTKDKMDKWLRLNNFSLSGAGVIYSQEKKGIMPELVDDIYKERVVNKKQMMQHSKALVHCKEGSDKYIEHKKMYEQLDIMQHTLKILLNSIYGVFANKHSPFYDIDHASSITLTGQAVIKAASNIVDDFVKEKYGVTESISHYNDTDSVHCSLKPVLNKMKKSFFNDKNELSDDVYELANEINDHLNEQINIWAKKELNSSDSRFVFKREAICPAGIYESKKHYILHVRDKGETDPIPCDTIKYVGVEVAKSTMSKEVKELIKKVVEAIIYTKEMRKTDDVYKWAYEEFKKLPIEKLSFRCSISKYTEYANKAKGFKVATRTPVHCKAAIFYNKLLEEYKISSKYDNIKDAMKLKWFYCKPNRYNFSVFGFVDKFPDEFTEIIFDYDKMFEKLVTPAIERLYECVKWRVLNLKNEFACDMFELFKEDNVEKS
jgi:DNA polymerase elongation subunit (family B)